MNGFTGSGVTSVFDPNSAVPLSKDEVQLLNQYAADAVFSGFEVFCTDCPDRSSSRARSKCCQLPEPKQRRLRSFVRALKAIAR
jgi:hypothetical protein